LLSIPKKHPVPRREFHPRTSLYSDYPSLLSYARMLPTDGMTKQNHCYNVILMLCLFFFYFYFPWLNTFIIHFYFINHLIIISMVAASELSIFGMYLGSLVFIMDRWFLVAVLHAWQKAQWYSLSHSNCYNTSKVGNHRNHNHSHSTKNTVHQSDGTGRFSSLLWRSPSKAKKVNKDEANKIIQSVNVQQTLTQNCATYIAVFTANLC